MLTAVISSIMQKIVIVSGLHGNEPAFVAVLDNHDQLAPSNNQAAAPGFPAVLLLGQTHRPFVIERGGAVIVKPGSVGRPKDGDPRASYATWENGRFFLKRVEYRVEETVAGLANVFRGALLDGLAGFLRRKRPWFF